MDGASINHQIDEDLERAACEFHALLDSLPPGDWDKPSVNAAWTNGQLVYHMLFGFVLVPSLFWMIKFWSRLPAGYSRRFAQLLDFATPMFNRVNALGPRGQERVFGRERAGRIFDRVIASIRHKAATLPPERWGDGMHYPRRWDPTFGDFMTFEDLLRYPSLHFRNHLRHLSAGSIDS